MLCECKGVGAGGVTVQRIVHTFQRGPHTLAFVGIPGKSLAYAAHTK